MKFIYLIIAIIPLLSIGQDCNVSMEINTNSGTIIGYAENVNIEYKIVLEGQYSPTEALEYMVNQIIEISDFKKEIILKKDFIIQKKYELEDKAVSFSKAIDEKEVILNRIESKLKDITNAENKQKVKDLLSDGRKTIKEARCISNDYKDDLNVYNDPQTNRNIYSFSINKLKEDPNYRFIGEYRNGLALIKQFNKYGYLDENGNYFKEPKYDQALPFYKDNSFVKQHSNWLCIDNKGKEELLKYPSNTTFKEGAFGQAIIGWYLKDGKYAYIIIDPKGKPISKVYSKITLVDKDRGIYLVKSDPFIDITLSPYLDDKLFFLEKLIDYKFRKSKYCNFDYIYGLVDLNGNEFIPTEYKTIKMIITDSITSNYFWIGESLNSGKKLITYNKNVYHLGNIPFLSQCKKSKTKDHWYIVNQRNQLLLIDDLAKEVHKIKEGLSYSDFNEKGLLLVRKKGRKVPNSKYAYSGIYTSTTQSFVYGLVNRKGQAVIPFEYEFMEERQEEGIIIAQKGENVKILNLKGDVIINSKFNDKITSISTLKKTDNALKICFNKKRVLFFQKEWKNKTINIYDKIVETVLDKYFVVTKNKKKGLLNSDGVECIPLVYNSLKVTSTSKAMIKDSLYWGVVDINNKVLISPQYNEITDFFNDLFVVDLSKPSWYEDAYFKYERYLKRGTSPFQEQVERLKTGHYLYETMGLGVVNTNGAEIIPPIFDKINFDKRRSKIIVNDNTIIDFKGNCISGCDSYTQKLKEYYSFKK